MKRRNFLKGLSLSGFALTYSNTLSDVFLQKHNIGAMSSLFKLTSVENANLSKSHYFSDYTQAFAKLQAGEIDFLISSPFYLIRNNPEFSLYGHFPGDLAPELKQQWAQQNYPTIQAHYELHGLQSQFIGLTSSRMIRFSNLTPQQIEEHLINKKEIRVAANGQRALWYSAAGFYPVKGSMADQLPFQLDMLKRNRLHLTEACAPRLFIESILHNNKIGSVATSHYRNESHHILVDNHSRRGLPIEVIFRKNSGALDDITYDLKKYLEREDLAQQQSFERLTQLFGREAFSELPQLACERLENCKENYLQVLSKYSSVSADMVSSYRQLGLRQSKLG